MAAAKDAEIYTEGAGVDIQEANAHACDVANLRTEHQEIDTLIQRAEEVHAEGGAILAENIETIQVGVLPQHIQQREQSKSVVGIDTLIQHAEVVHAVGSAIHAANVGTLNVVQVIQGSLSDRIKADVDELVKGFCESVEERCLKETSGGIIDSYKEHNLTEPEKEFTPQLKKVNFYKGDWVKESSDRPGFERRRPDFERRRTCFEVFVTKKQKKKKLIQEKEYLKEDDQLIKLHNAKDISVTDVLQFAKDERYKAIVGQAGSGKSTLMKRLARDITLGSLLIKKEENEPYKPAFVHFLNVRDIPVTGNEMKKITPCDLLFGKVMANVKMDSIDHGFEWLLKNQDKAVFFFDGLDQATWSLQESCNQIRYKDKASTSTIIRNILQGNLFPKVPIIVSSREHILSPLTGNLRPHEVIGLAGFTVEDRKQVFIAIAGEDSEKLWNLMSTKSSSLARLCSIPIFLVFTVIVYKLNPSAAPDTMSGVMVKILKIFLQSDHLHEREKLREVLNGLKQMAFKGTTEGRVLFTQQDLKEFNLNPKRVRDLVISVPGLTELGKHLMEGDYRLFFCHQSIQEMLTALNIIDMDLEAFTNFVNTILHEDHWSVVRRFVCGALLNEKTYKDATNTSLIDVSDVNDKMKILKQSLKKQLQQTTKNSRGHLELFSSVYESNDNELIKSNIREVNIKDLALTPNDMYVLSSMLQRCSELKQVKLKGCHLNIENVDILNSVLQSSEVKFKILNISQNKNLGVDGCRKIGFIGSKCQIQELKMRDCELSSAEIKGLQEGLADSQIEKIEMSTNKLTGSTIADFVGQCHVKELVLWGGLHLPATSRSLLNRSVQFCFLKSYHKQFY